uniref:Uncharacterized protein n=1 Tax=Rhizophora mucronata TaxID=61149 RepID=A0A2P2QSL1_RHIMU
MKIRVHVCASDTSLDQLRGVSCTEKLLFEAQIVNFLPFGLDLMEL